MRFPIHRVGVRRSGGHGAFSYIPTMASSVPGARGALTPTGPPPLLQRAGARAEGAADGVDTPQTELLQTDTAMALETTQKRKRWFLHQPVEGGPGGGEEQCSVPQVHQQVQTRVSVDPFAPAALSGHTAPAVPAGSVHAASVGPRPRRAPHDPEGASSASGAVPGAAVRCRTPWHRAAGPPPRPAGCSAPPGSPTGSAAGTRTQL